MTTKYLCNISKKIKNNSNKIIAFILTVSLSLGYYQAYADNLPTVTLIVNDKWRNIKTNEKTVGEFLDSQKIILEDKDTINVDMKEEITQDLKIIIDKAFEVTFSIDTGENIIFKTNAQNIGTAVNELKLATGKNYKLADGQSSASKLEPGLEIQILEYIEKYKTIEYEIKHTSKTVQNKDILEGVKNVKTNGEDGIKKDLIKEIYLEGKLLSTETVNESVLKAPVEEIIEIGTKKKEPTVNTEKGTFAVKKELNMKASAYTSSVECTGKTPSHPAYGITASGMKAAYGVIAVDPSVIPLGTKLYVEGYGYAVAGDTGGAIRGNKIDLYFNTYNEAINYGVKNVKVYVLGDKI